MQVFSVLLFGAIVLLWLRSEGALALAPVVGAVLIMADFGDAARASTPDLLCSALFLGGLYAYMRRPRGGDAPSCSSSPSWCGRTTSFSSAIFAVLLMAFRQRAGARWPALPRPSSPISPSRTGPHHPGWWPHLWFSSIEQHYNMDGFEPAVLGRRLSQGVRRIAVVRAISFNSWVGVAVLALAGWYATEPRRLPARSPRRHPVCRAGARRAGEIHRLPDPRHAASISPT